MEAVPEPVPAQVVANAFVKQYYHILYNSPGLVHKFYQDSSKLGRPEEDGSMSITTTMTAINEKILSLNYSEFNVEIRSVDAQDSFEGGVLVFVTGYLSGEDRIRIFAQTFFLAPQDKGYFVLNDMFRYVENATMHAANHSLSNEVVTPVVSETSKDDDPQVVENQTPEQSIPLAEDSNGGEVYNPLENGDVPVVVEEEVPVAEVINEVPDDSNMVLVSNAKIGETPKKSFASIVKDTAAVVSSPPPVTRKPIAKSQNLVNQSSASGNGGQISDVIAAENGNGHAGEADGYSIYIKGLPMTVTVDMVADVFKQFGPIKRDGIQVRSNKGFCFGFVEYELANAVEKAIEASPIAIGTRQVVVEEKKSSRGGGSNRGRFPPGRGSGFRSEGQRGRGNYGGGRGYNRDDYGNRSDNYGYRSGDYGNRNGNRNGPSNRGDEYQRSDFTSNGGRGNRPTGVANGNSRSMAPRVPATA